MHKKVVATPISLLEKADFVDTKSTQQAFGQLFDRDGLFGLPKLGFFPSLDSKNIFTAILAEGIKYILSEFRNEVRTV